MRDYLDSPDRDRLRSALEASDDTGIPDDALTGHMCSSGAQPSRRASAPPQTWRPPGTGGEGVVMDSAEFDDTLETEELKWSGAWRRRIDGPDRNTYRVLREHFRKQCMARHEVCWICEGAVDYSLKYPDAMAWELDHFVPVSVDESLALSP